MGNYAAPRREPDWPHCARIVLVASFDWRGTTDRVRAVLRRESSRMSLANSPMTFGGVLVTAAYLFALFHFWNTGLALAGGGILVSRLPDLMWEIRAGRKPHGTTFRKVQSISLRPRFCGHHWFWSGIRYACGNPDRVQSTGTPNAGIASRLTIGHHWPGDGELER